MTNLLFTGASGFLGANIKPLLEQKYKVSTLGLSESDNFYCNIAQDVPELTNSYDVILHAAGKAHSIPQNKQEEKVFYDVNYEGTKNLCRGLEKIGVPKTLIFISTVAVYGCESGELINEDYPLNGNTPYALSKIQAEEFLLKWGKKNKVSVSILRPSLIAGPNPPGNLGAMIKGIQTGRYLSIAEGKAKKSVLMVEDIATLIPLLEDVEGVFNVCDSKHPTFRDLEIIISKQLGKSLPLSIPYWSAKILAKIGDCMGKYAPINSPKLEKIVNPLTFNNEKIRNELNWEPLNSLSHFKIK